MDKFLLLSENTNSQGFWIEGIGSLAKATRPFGPACEGPSPRSGNDPAVGWTGTQLRREIEMNVVFGTGPLGLAVIRHLDGEGEEVRAVNSSGRVEVPGGVKVVAADAADPERARGVCEGPPPSTTAPALRTTGGLSCIPRSWRRSSGPRPPPAPGSCSGTTCTPTGRWTGESPKTSRTGLPRPTGGPGLRSPRRSWRPTRTAGCGRPSAAARTSSARTHQSTVGDHVFARALAGKPAQVLGNPDLPHTVTYIDFGRALVTLGEREEALGEVWHVPSPETVTVRRFVELVFQEVGGGPRLRAAPAWGVALAALFNPTMRAVKEQLYQHQGPWVVDSARFERTFGWQATPLPKAVRSTGGLVPGPLRLTQDQGKRTRVVIVTRVACVARAGESLTPGR